MMSVEYSVEIKVGYVFDLHELTRPFEKIKPEESHLEPRWDPVSYTHLTLPTNREV